MDPDESADPNMPTKDQNFRLRAVDWSIHFHESRPQSGSADVVVLSKMIYEFLAEDSSQRTVQ